MLTADASLLGRGPNTEPREGFMMDATEFPRAMGKVAPRELALNGITRYADLTDWSERELLAIHGVGPKAIRILNEELASRGLSLRGD